MDGMDCNAYVHAHTHTRTHTHARTQHYILEYECLAIIISRDFELCRYFYSSAGKTRKKQQLTSTYVRTYVHIYVITQNLFL